MKHCPNDECRFLVNNGERSTFEDHVERCVDCGAKLAYGEPPARSTEAAASGRLVTLTACEDPLEANGIVDLLQSSGLPVFIGGQYVTPPVPRLPSGVTSYQLQVRERDLTEASAVLEAAERQAETVEIPDFDAPEEEVCPNCGSTAIELREAPPGIFGSASDGLAVVRVCTRCNASL